MKEGETLGFPYSELIRRFANIIQQPQSVLITIGYSFNDEASAILAGQWMPYLQFSLADFHAGVRDMPRKMEKRMKKMLKKEGEESLDELVHFYGSLTEQK